jgi:hypothetical protein
VAVITGEDDGKAVSVQVGDLPRRGNATEATGASAIIAAAWDMAPASGGECPSAYFVPARVLPFQNGFSRISPSQNLSTLSELLLS